MTPTSENRCTEPSTAADMGPIAFTVMELVRQSTADYDTAVTAAGETQWP